MAIIPLEKIHIIVHKNIKDKFLKDLQKEHIVHITELKDTQTSASEELNIVNNALSHLAGYRKRGVLEMFLTMKTPVDYESFEKTNKEYDYQRVTGKIQHIRQTIENNRSSLKKLQDDIEILHPWTPMDISFEELHSMQKASAIAASVPSRDLLEELLKKVQDIPFSYQEINEIGSTVYLLFFVANEHIDIIRSRLVEAECTLIEFYDLKGKPTDIIRQHKEEIARLEQNTIELKEQESSLAREIATLELITDYIAN